MRIATIFTASLLALTLASAQVVLEPQILSPQVPARQNQKSSEQPKQRIAVLPSVGELEAQRLNLLTDKVREIASKTLPADKFVLLRQDAVMEMIGDKDYFAACKEGTCIGELAKKANANYGARCDVFKIDNNLVLKFELYSVKDEAILETFTDYNAKDFLGMLALLEQRLPSAFGKMPGASLVLTASAPVSEFPQPEPAVSTPTPTSQTTNDVATLLTEGTIVPGVTLADKLAWLQRSADSHNTYILEINVNENIAPHTFEYKGAINITIALRGVGANRTIRLKSHGTMFTIKTNVTFVLENNITLQGHSGNNSNMINIEGGIFRMNSGSTITGNNNNGGVYVKSGIFEMTGGTISGNGRNTEFLGGGVDVRGTFIMSGGSIYGNIASKGGGVYVADKGTFTMSGGTIVNNTANGNGGGVYLDNGTFTMRGGTITNNTAKEYGGGVHIKTGFGGGIFSKTGGTITGYNSDQINGNVVKDDNGTIARRGHAVYVNENQRKETTSGPRDNMSSKTNGNSGGWDN